MNIYFFLLLIATMIPIVLAVYFVLVTYPRYKNEIQKMDDNFDRCDRDDRVMLKSNLQLEVGRIIRLSLFVVFLWGLIIIEYFKK